MTLKITINIQPDPGGNHEVQTVVLPTTDTFPNNKRITQEGHGSSLNKPTVQALIRKFPDPELKAALQTVYEHLTVDNATQSRREATPIHPSGVHRASE